LDIESERPKFDISKVQSHSLLVGRPAASADLPQSRHSGWDAEPPHLFSQWEVAEIAKEYGARSHETHVASYYVPKLWELIDAVFAKESTQGCHSGIVDDFQECMLGTLVGQADFRFLRIGDHRAELQHRENAATVSDPLLDEKRRTGTGPLDESAHEQEAGRQQY
jgi:hypothetical protein